MRDWGTARRRRTSARDNNCFQKGFPLGPAAFVTFSRRICVVGALACFASLAAASAAEPRPDASIKNKIVDASVLLDNKIKADPALAADCLAEGKQWLTKTVADAEASRKQDPE